MKSGLNEIINILGYKVTPEPVMIHYQDGICSLRRSIFFSFTIPSQINGINHPCRSIPVHTARFPFVDWTVLISYFSKKKYIMVIILCLLAQNKAHLYKRHVEMIGHRTTIFFFLLKPSMHTASTRRCNFVVATLRHKAPLRYIDVLFMLFQRKGLVRTASSFVLKDSVY